MAYSVAISGVVVRADTVEEALALAEAVALREPPPVNRALDEVPAPRLLEAAEKKARHCRVPGCGSTDHDSRKHPREPADGAPEVP